MADRVTLEERFERLTAALADRPGVTLPGEAGGRGFGSDALRVSGSIFAMLSRGQLVVKLPRARVAELIASEAGEPFDAGKGRPMREWVALPDADDATWLALAEEALAFVRR
jgi:hypothetical protein